MYIATNKAIVCRYTRKNAMHLSEDITTDPTTDMHLVLNNNCVDGVIKSFIHLTYSPVINFKFSKEDNILDITTTEGLLTVPVNTRIGGVTNTDVETHDMITTAIDGLRNGQDMTKVVAFKVSAADLLDTLSTASKLSNNGTISMTIGIGGVLSFISSSRGMESSSTLCTTTTDIINTQPYGPCLIDPRGIQEVLEVCLTQVKDDVEVNIEVVVPTDPESERNKMWIIQTPHFKGVAIWGM